MKAIVVSHQFDFFLSLKSLSSKTKNVSGFCQTYRTRIFKNNQEHFSSNFQAKSGESWWNWDGWTVCTVNRDADFWRSKTRRLSQQFRKSNELYKMQNNIMGYMSLSRTFQDQLEKENGSKCSSSATKATPSCHITGRGKWDIINLLQQFLKKKADLNWGDHGHHAMQKQQIYNCETISVLTTCRSTLKQRIYNKRYFLDYVLQFSLPFLNLGNISISTSWWNRPQNSLIVWSPYLDRKQIRHWLRKFLKQVSHAIHDPLLDRVEFQWNFDFCKNDLVKLYVTTWSRYTLAPVDNAC